MITINLSQQLSGHVFPFMLVFVRMGAALMLFPGIGEAFVTPRIRLLFALLVSFLVFPVLMAQLPPQPSSIPDLARLVFQEALIGIFFGSMVRLLMGTIETAGAIVAVQIGLSNAMILNPALASQSALPAAFLGIVAVALLFVTGLDHFLLRSLMETYALFPAGTSLPAGDVAQSYMQLASRSFTVGVEIAAPFLMIGLMLYVAVGFMQRMMPQVQLFLVLLPVQIWGGFVLFAATIGIMLAVWLRYFDQALGALLTHG